MKELALAEVSRLIEPGPVVLLATRSRQGRANVMTMSRHMMVEFTPPTIARVVSSDEFSFAALQETKECVIAVPAPRTGGEGRQDRELFGARHGQVRDGLADATTRQSGCLRR